MYIEKIKIGNFRNLNGVEINFHPNINFIVGENNIGKSNFLDCLDVIFNGRKFKEDDFADHNLAIEIFLTLKLTEEEKGNFDDNFDPSDSSKINLHIVQEDPDSDLKYYHAESANNIHYTSIRAVNFIKYSSLRSPNDELNFDKNKGVGKFLGYIVKKYIYNQTETIDEYINPKGVHDLINYVNEYLDLIEVFKQFSIKADVDNDIENLLFKMLVLKENNEYELKYIGDGIQFSAMISLLLLEKIIKLVENKNAPLFEMEDGSRYISAIVGLDEPEIHLHPYMQRSLTKYVLNVLKNKNDQFLELISDFFNLSGINGQAILVTHSPNIILDDYHQVVRFYKDKSGTLAVSGNEILFENTKIEKQLLRNMHYIKEAFFARCVILVEGDTELGALPLFAEKMDVYLDQYGITIMKADGCKSIDNLAKLLKKFKIEVCAIFDKDDNYKSAGSSKREFINFTTDGRDFEEDVVDELIKKNSNIMFEILKEYDNNAFMGKEELNKINKKYNVIKYDIVDNIKFFDIEKSVDKDIVKLFFLSWLQENKNIILGRTIGEKISIECIPEKYKEIITKAVELSEGTS